LPADLRRWLPVGLLIVADALLVNLGLTFAYLLRYDLELGPEVAAENYVPYSEFVPIGATLAVLVVLILVLRGHYGRSRFEGLLDEAISVAAGLTTAVAVMIVIVFALRGFYYSRLVFVYTWAIAIGLLVGERTMVHGLRSYLLRRGIGSRKLVLVGAGSAGRKLMKHILSQPQLGYQLVGFFDDPSEPMDEAVVLSLPEASELPRYLGDTGDLPAVLKGGVDSVILALPAHSHGTIYSFVEHCRSHGMEVLVVPDIFEMSFDEVRLDSLSDVPLIAIKDVGIKGWRLLLKRGMDLILTLLVGSLAVLPCLVIALLIKLESPGPVLFRQKRVGKGGKVFTLYKFRSMKVGAEAERHLLEPFNEVRGPIFKMRNDPRLTRVGRFIRRWSLDELPQLINILLGQMSWVGPRPPVPDEVEKYQEWHRRRLEITPGLTGLWQVNGRSLLSFDEMVKLDLYYSENWSLTMDLKILLRSIPAVLSGRGAF
jgi:exopolysaccharide biosynthesis polyprenyl glycosylphosphotransferase